MPFIPHTEAEVRDMLKEIGVSSIADLFDEIPADLMIDELSRIPTGMSEMEISRLMRERAAQDGTPLCFAGAGAYEHHIPSAVWQITTRGEFYTAYTPYQAEASQGTLQLLYEYQSMMAGLTAMDVSNASMYDGATALAEAVLMAVRASKKKSSRVLVPRSVHPAYRKVLSTIVSTQNIWTAELARWTGRAMPVVPERHAVIALECAEAPYTSAMPVFKDLCSPGMLYCRSYGGRQMLVSEGLVGEKVSTSETQQADVPLDYVAEIGAQVAERFPAYETAGLASSWTGVYDVSPDWNPVLGRVPGVEGLIVGFGFSGHGFKLSPTVGRVLAQEALGLATDVSLAPYSIERFARGELLLGKYGSGAVS